MTNTINSVKPTEFVTALNAKFENKQANKKTDISGDFTDDTTSYPTVQAVKGYVEGKNIALTKLSAANTTQGYASTYEITQGNASVGKIDIPKDKMLRSASVETVGEQATALEAQHNLSEGDSYILLVVNTVDNDGTSNLVIPVNSFFDLQEGDGVSITLTNGVYSVAEGYTEGIIDDYLDAITTALNE